MERQRVLPILMIALGMLTSCSSKSGGTAPINFPKGFLWGVSTAAEQSEGGITNNDWYAWEQMGNTPPVGLADDFYHLYAQDFTNAQAMHLNAFRLTFEWSRVVPTRPADIYAPLSVSDPAVDMTAVAHYHDIINSLIAHGLTPVVTLTHYTVPQWVDNPGAYDKASNSFTDGSLGGWTNTATAYAFANYAGFMAQQFSTTVKYWLTENEPLPDTLAGYVLGQYPPGFMNISYLTATTMPFSASVVTVVKNMIMGHALAYHEIHAVEPGAMVSIAKNSIFASARPNDPASTAAANAFDHAYNLTYLDAVTKGVFDDGLTGTTNTEIHPEWANTLDYIGVNYYSDDYVVPFAGILIPINAVPCDPTIGAVIPLGSLGCPAQNPPETQGLTEILVEYAQRYHLPMLITENGYGKADPVGKTKYIVQNIMAVKDAIDQGADILGYMYWTMDYDYEWTSGYAQNFGLFYVDDFTSCTKPDCGLVPNTATDFARTPVQPAVDVYSSIAAGNSISPSIIDQYGH
ncbi:MAG: family 1 glycosylhydrolase [Deltaproteobacteria bacterium]|nr:family 1 glycosylhydrolase [Deltaproteobacteria bacterium]MCL5278027.1 family 1 glycosylhydrolase [Deltaproteobacteria bacterium]